MANEVRTSENLLSIRCRVVPAQGGARLEAELFRGATAIGNPRRLPLTQLGFPASGEGDQNGFEPEVPNLLWEVFHEAGIEAGTEPVWLQLAYGADILGAYPWESVFADVTDRTILRIPNFVRPAYQRETGRPIAICAAAPRAKGAPPWEEELIALLIALDKVGGQEVALFLGADDLTANAINIEQIRDRFTNISLTQAPLPKPSDGPDRSSAISQRPTVSNPWLAWIADSLGVTGAHAVHFFCPGFASDSHGALALPEHPTHDHDTQWSRFVGAPELARFCDRIATQSVGITAIGDPRWHTGLRLFANELSWLRPGPIMVSFPGDTAPLERVYTALLKADPLEPYPAPNLLMSVHPKTILQADPLGAVGTITRGVRAEGNEARMALEELGTLEPMVAGLGDRMALPDDLLRAFDTLSNAQPKSVSQEARDAGALRALDYLSRIIGEEKDR